MAIHVKVDEDLPRAVADVLRASGHNAMTVLDQHMGGFQDPELWQRIQQEDRWLITADKGFGDIRLYPPGSHVGIILLRLERESRAGYVRLTQALLQSKNLELLRGSVIIVTSAGIRVQRPPEK